MTRHRCASALFVLRFALVLLAATSGLDTLAHAPDTTVHGARFRIRVVTPGLVERTAVDLRTRGYDLMYVDPKTGTVEFVGSERDLSALTVLGYDPRAVPEPAAPEALSDYLSPDEVAARLAQYQANYPALAQRVVYATDHQGRPAYALKISDNVSAEEDEPAVLYVAQHHAREVMTPEVALDIAEQLLTNYGIDPDVTRWVDETEVFIIPNHNPDGTNEVFTGDAMWRKNRRDNGNGTFGVDPNRNYPVTWNRCGGSSGDPGSDTYRGPSAGSEPTTIGIVNLARAQRPVYFVSYHTYGEYALHVYGCSNSFAAQPDGQLFRELANEVSAKMEGDAPGTWYRFGTPWELLYDVDGDTDGYMYGELGSFGVTFELNTSGQGFQPDYATWRNSTVLRARPGWRYFLDALSRSRLTGHVKDACTGTPLVGAGVQLAEQAFSNGEVPRTTGTSFARYDWPVRPGHYTLGVTNTGYTTQSWPTDVGFAPFAREIALVPAGSRAIAADGLRLVESGGDADGQADPGETLDLFATGYATGDAVSGVTVALSSADPYVTIVDGTAGFGDFAPAQRKEAADALRVQIAADAPDGHVIALTATFAAGSPLCAAQQTYTLRVTRGVPADPAVEETLDQNPNWLVENSGPGGWAFGVPSAVGPTSAYTGQNVYGTNLTGNYADSSTYRLTAGPFDLTGLRRAELRFARFLRSEPGYDIARVEIKSAARPDWTTVWEGFGRDTAWVPVRYDVSSIVEDDAEVYVRFSLASDNGSVDAGFYLDDVAFAGELLPGSGARVKYDSSLVDDANTAYGNGNGALDAKETVALKVTVKNRGTEPATGVSAVLTALTPGVTVHDGVAVLPNLAPNATALTLAPHFSFSTDIACSGTVSFRLTARWAGGGRADSIFTVPVGALGEIPRLSDTMETDTGWTPGGDARAGLFVRQDPNGVTDATAGPVQPEDDATPAPGTTAWVTGNPPVIPGFNPRSGDVDRGTAWVRSPAFDGTGTGRLLLRFSRFYHRSSLGPLDISTYRAEISPDGVTWTTVETLEANASAWTAKEFDITDLAPLSTTMRVRFSAAETARTPTDPITELLIDDVSVVRRSITCSPFSPSETKIPNPVGNSLLGTRTGPDVALSWTPPAADTTHDPARFYPVYRSSTPATGFTLRAEPTSPTFRDPDASGPTSGSWFYLVAARNAAGTSPETPTP